MLSAMVLLSFGAVAQWDEGGSPDRVGSAYNSSPVTVTGRWSESDRTSKRVRQLKRKIDDAVDNTVENMRLSNEERLGNQLESMFKGGALTSARKSDRVSVSQASPERISIRENNFFGDGKTSVGVFGGVSNLYVADEEVLGENDYFSNSSFSLEFSQKLNSQVDLGLGLGYSSMRFKKSSYLYGDYYSSYTQFYGEPYSLISGNIFSADVRGRFYLSEKGFFNPFIAGNFGFNYLTLGYDKLSSSGDHYGDDYYSNGYSSPYCSYYGCSLSEQQIDHSSTFASGGVGLGIVLNFSKRVGLIFQGSYNKNFGGTTDEPLYSSQSQEVLDDLGRQISKGSQVKFNLGVMASF